MRQLVVQQVLGLAGLFFTILGAHAANLVPNGDFENPGKNNLRPDKWSQWVDSNKVQPPELIQTYLLTAGRNNSKCVQVGHSYEEFLQLAYGSSSSAHFRLDSGASISIDPDSYYKFSIWYKTQDIADEQCSVDLGMSNDGSFIDTRIFYLPPSTDWNQFVAYFVPFRPSDRGFENNDEGANQLRITLSVVSSMGTALYDDCSIEEVSQAEYYANYPIHIFQPDPLTARRKAPPMFSPSGTWTIKRDPQGSWWFVRPDGRPVWLRGTQNFTVYQTPNPELFSALPAKYKDSEKTNELYRADSMARLGTLGFNSSAITDGNTDPMVHPKGEAFFAYLPADPGSDFPTSYLLLDKDGEYNELNKPMPDPYNPEYQTWLRNHIRSSLDELDWKFATDGIPHPDFAGYWTENEVGPEHLDRFIWSPFCAQQFVQYCRELYQNDPAALNAAWSSSYATFDISSFGELLEDSNKAKIIRHHLDDPLWPVLTRFIIDLNKAQYRLWCDYIREYECEKLGDADGDGISEKKHLISSNRFAFSKYPYRYNYELELAIQAMAELNQERPGYYFDFVSMTNYPGNGNFEGIDTKTNFNYIEKIAQMANLPIMIAEFAVHGRDCGFPTGNDVIDDIGWFHQQVDTQDDRALVYDKMIRQWASSPHIIGAQWYQWSDVLQMRSGSSALPVAIDGNSKYRGRNSGIIDNANNFYKALTDQIKLTHAALDQAFAPSAAADPVWLSTAD